MKNTDQADPAGMPDDAVNEELARLFGWKRLALGWNGKMLGVPPHAQENKSGDGNFHDLPNYCSPDAPHSLRVALVKAVEKAGQRAVDCLGRMAQDYIKSQPSSRYLFPILLTVPQPLLARWVLAALRAAKSAKESQEGNES